MTTKSNFLEFKGILSTKRRCQVFSVVTRSRFTYVPNYSLKLVYQLVYQLYDNLVLHTINAEMDSQKEAEGEREIIVI